MKKLIQTIASFFTRNHVEKVQKRSSNIFNVFSSTVNQLKEINSLIDGHVDVRREKIKTMLDENNAFTAQKAENDHVIGKINEFFKK